MCAFKIQQFPKVSPEDADTYKCFATNEYGKAVCTVLLNVIEGKIPALPNLLITNLKFFCYNNHSMCVYSWILQDKRITKDTRRR